MKPKKIFTSCLCMLLSLLMAFYMVPMDAIAAMLSQGNNEHIINESLNENESIDALFELTEKRTEDTKYIMMSDGSIKALVYQNPVHEKDENCVWQDIDNSLLERNDGFESANARVKFAKKITGSGEVFTLKDGNRKITLYLVGAEKKVPISVVNDGKSKKPAATKFEELSVLYALTSSVRYNDVINGTDLEYILSPNGIKENIIIDSSAENFTYTFAIQLNNLSAKLTEDGCIRIFDEDETFFVMPAPYMYDSKGDYSNSVTYSLEDQYNGKYILTISADATWINDKNRSFPVTIDPTISISDGSNNSDIYDISVSSDADNPEVMTYYNNVGTLITNGIKKTYETYIRFDMPSLPNGSVITSSVLKLYQTSCNSSSDTVIAVKEVNEAWSDVGNSWVRPASSENIIDYVITSSSDNNSTISFDLTMQTKKWQNRNNNYGIVLAPYSAEECTAFVRFASMSYSSNKPVVEVSYRYNTGIEDCYTYQTMNVGSAGTVYLSDFSLQSTVIRTLANNGIVSFDMVYNSVFSDGGCDSLQFANGWMFNSNESATLGNPYILWKDEDGTIHYYDYASGSGFIDEENSENTIFAIGLNVVSDDLEKFCAADSYYAQFTQDYRFFRMVKENGEESLFCNGVLVAKIDIDGNLIEYHYNESSPSALQSLPSSSQKNLTSIYTTSFENGEYGSKTPFVTLEYGSNELTLNDVENNISYRLILDDLGNLSELHDIKNNEETVLATYDYDYHILTMAQDVEEKAGLEFVVNNGQYERFKDFRVKSDGSLVYGRSIYIPSSSYAQTSYIDMGTSGSNTTFIVNYLFDSQGRTICVYTNDFDMNIYNASSVFYGTTVGETNTRYKLYGVSGTPAQNMLCNSGAEETSIGFGSKTTSYYRSGTHSYKLTGNNTLSESVVLNANEEYCFSAYVNLEYLNSVTKGDGAYLTVTNSNGYSERSYKLFTKTEKSNDQWQRIILPFTVPSNGTYTLSLCGSGFTGNIYFDDIQLEAGKDYGDYSYVSNGALNQQNSWTTNDPSVVTYTSHSTNASHVTWDCIKICGSPVEARSATQRIWLNTKGKDFNVSAFAFANASAQKEGRFFGVRAELHYIDNNNNLSTQTVEVPFSEFVQNSWQFATGAIVTDHEQTLQYIDLSLAYDYTCGNAYFTGVSLTEGDVYVDTDISEENIENEETTTPTEQEEPNEVTVTLSQALTATEVSQSQLQSYSPSVILPSELQMTSTTEDNGVTTTVYTSDTLYITVQNFTDNGANLSVVSISVYDEDGNIVVTVDPLGGVTRYTYDSDGNLTTETDPLGTTIDYTYIDGKVSSFGVSGIAQIAYIYNGDKLTSVLSGLASQQGYTFEYDDFGNITRVKAGNYTLVTYAYDSLSGNLTSVIYGNGCTVGYSYDNLDRVNKISYNGSARYTFAYTKEHELYRTEDLLNGETIMALDDPLHSCTIRMNTATSELQELSYSFYNAEEQLITQRTHILLNGEWTTQEYGYNYDEDTGKLTSLEIGNHTITYEYDLLGRKVSENNSSYGKTYTYRNVLGKTCDLVDTITYTKSNGVNLVTYSYEYDAKGNITKVYKNGILYNQYTYDALGQLVREDNREANRSYTYEYDSRGNFVAKHEHSFSTGALGSPLGNGPVNYTYYTDSWKDRLKTYNGNDTITYDSIGNPLFYDNGSEYDFAWEGRQLQSATKGSQTYAYTYNADGLRTSKTVGSTVYHYYWSGEKLIAMTYGNHRMKFTYTEDGTPYSVTCYDAFLDKEYECLYITNLQGDVVGIYDPEISSMVVSYTYDAWGRILSISGTSSDYAQLEMNNPLRYRGYCYDDETGFYYLQSRYYDPVTGRFLNADDVMFLGATGTVLSTNLFAYCENDAVNKSDPEGYGPFLAIGIQVVVTIGRLTIGLEALWSTTNWKFYLFGFVGGSRNFNVNSLKQTEAALMEDIMYLMRSVPKFSISSFSIFKKIDASVSFIAVLGNRRASFPRDYCGWFTGLSLSFRNITVSGAYSISQKIKIGSLGLGVTTSSADISFGQTFYFQLTGNNALKNNLNALKSGIQNKLAFLKLFVCFF